MLYLDIFNRRYVDSTPVSGVVVPSDINYLRRLYNINKDKIESYYQSRNFAVKNTHILSRVVEHLPIYPELDAIEYLENIDRKLTYLFKHFKFTSDLEYGVVHPDYFFGNSGEEIIFDVYENFNVSDVANNWRKAKAVSVITHQRNDLKLLLPLGNDDGSRSGLAALGINGRILATKYREFQLEQYRHSLTGRAVLSKNHFVIKYVLSTMLEDIIDHTLLNKVMDKFYGREEVTPQFKHRFMIHEPTTQISRYIDNTLDVITSKNLDFVNILHNIQLVFSVDASDLLAFNDMSVTRQNRGALLTTRLEHMCFLYDVSRTKTMNRHYLNDWKRLVVRLERDNNFLDNLSYTESEKIKELIYKVKQM